MTQYYFESLKQTLAKPTRNREDLQKIVDDSQFFFGVLRIKLQSKDPVLQKEAAVEIAVLRKLLEQFKK